MTADQVRDIRNFCGGLLSAYGVCAFIAFWVLVQIWARSAPDLPDAVHAFRHNEHGSVTYFTAFQATSSTLLFATSIPLAFVGMFISPKINMRSRSSRFAWSATWDQEDPRKLGWWGSAAGVLCAVAMILVLGPVIVRALNGAGVILPFG